MSIYHHPRIVTDGLVLHLDAANKKSYPGNGTVWYDLSKNKVAGTLINGPTFSMDAYGAIVFDGSNDYVNIPYVVGTFPSGNAERTIETVFYPTSTTQKEVLGIGNNSGGGYRLGVWLDGSYIGIETLNGGVRTSDWSGANNWVHFTAVLPPGATLTSQIKLYINGIEKTASLTGSNNTINTQTTAYVIGTVPGAIGFHQFAGKVAIAKLYNRALTSDQIYQNFNAIKSRYGL